MGWSSGLPNVASASSAAPRRSSARILNSGIRMENVHQLGNYWDSYETLQINGTVMGYTSVNFIWYDTVNTSNYLWNTVIVYQLVQDFFSIHSMFWKPSYGVILSPYRKLDIPVLGKTPASFGIIKIPGFCVWLLSGKLRVFYGIDGLFVIFVCLMT